MNALEKKFLFVAAAGVATWVFTQSPTAQTTDHAAAAQAAMEQAVKEMGVQSKSSASAHDKIDAAMTGPPAALPSEAERKAIAAMSK